MRVLIDHVAGGELLAGDELTDEHLARLYAAPSAPWLRVNFVSTVDGAATGADGKSGSINNAADKRIFELLRSQADAIVIGAGTATIEGYRPVDKPIVVVTGRGTIPPTLAESPTGSLLVATHASASGLDSVRETVGEENLIIAGAHTVDLVALKAELGARGFANLLSEGGPTLFTEMLVAGVADEVCTTTVPRVVGGAHVRIAHGRPAERDLHLQVLLEEDDTLIERWFA